MTETVEIAVKDVTPGSDAIGRENGAQNKYEGGDLDQCQYLRRCTRYESAETHPHIECPYELDSFRN